MAKPNSKDKALAKKRKETLAKKLLPDGSPKRKMDDNLAKELFRSAVRKRWMFCPQKLYFKELMRLEDNRPETRTKWVWKCKKCEDLVKDNHFDVDHKDGNIPFTEWDTARDYASSIFDKGFDDFQILCNDKAVNNCHATKTRAEALGIDWTTEEGWNLTLKEQEFTRVCKLKAEQQKKFLLDNGVEPGKNIEVRKKQIRGIIVG